VWLRAEALIEAWLDTGAGSGIGRHAALLFAQEGASVVAADRNLAAAARTVDAMHELNGQGVAVGGDVSIADDVAAMVAKAEKVK
jgi:NAD(P)-dependent dehydrogenase (short-subunit alcohol dehydrogenase family)